MGRFGGQDYPALGWRRAAPAVQERVKGKSVNREEFEKNIVVTAADRSSNSKSREALIQIADEERVHLRQLGKLMDTIDPGPA